MITQILSQAGILSGLAAILWVLLKNMKGKAFEVMQWLLVAIAVCILIGAVLCLISIAQSLFCS